MANNKRSLRFRRGQALVESGLVVLAFLALLIGALDIGQVLFVHQSLVERVRMGLRWATVNPYDEAKIRSMIRFAQPVPPSGTLGFLGVTDSNIQIVRQDAGTATDRIQIALVNYPYQFLSPWLVKTFTNNMAVVETLSFEYKPD